MFVIQRLQTQAELNCISVSNFTIISIEGKIKVKSKFYLQNSSQNKLIGPNDIPGGYRLVKWPSKVSGCLSSNFERSMEEHLLNSPGGLVRGTREM